MMRFRLSTCFSLCAATLFGLAGRTAAADQVSFKGRLHGDVVITPVPGGPPTLVDVQIAAVGNGTHLGKFELSIPHRVDRSTTPPSAAGFFLFTAANGDTVTATFTGAARPSPTPGVLAITETATITGGTGRFAGTSGSFVAERLFNTITGETTGSYTGTISRP